jgi:signal transduction histidine kinase
VPQILIASEDAGLVTRLKSAMARNPEGPQRASVVSTAEGLFDRVESGPALDCIILGFGGGAERGIAILRELLDFNPLLAVIFATRSHDDGLAVAALQAGAMDVVCLDGLQARPEALERALNNVIERGRLARRVADQQESMRRFAQVLVHDLRAPLRSVRGGVEMLLEDMSGEERGRHTEVLGFIRRGAEQMDQLIVALHGYTSVDETPEEVAPVALEERVSALRWVLKADLLRLGAVLSVDGTLPTVTGNPVLILQLLQNLVANGIKYNRSATPRVEIGAIFGAETCRIEARDNGIGIEEDYLEAVFAPFRRLHRDDEFEGTGLGLATCRRIVGRMGGQLTCRSEPGRGTVFMIDLPLASVVARAERVVTRTGS